MNIFHLDYETFSEADLTAVGAYRYAFDPSTEILCASLSLEGHEPIVWRCDGVWRNSQDLAKWLEWLPLLSDPLSVVWAHNANFECAISEALFKKTFNAEPPSLHQWRCTQALARSVAIPASLEKCAEYLQLGQQKDKRGKELIKLLCMMRPATPGKPGKPAVPGREKGPPGSGIRAKKGIPEVPAVPPRGPYRIFPADDPKAFDELCDYCAQDNRAERAVHDALKPVEFKRAQLETWQFDIKMNRRGLPVNLDGLFKASKLVDEAVSDLSTQFFNLTGFNITQGEVFKAWLKEHGYTGKDLTADSVSAALEEGGSEFDVMLGDAAGLDEIGRQALQLKAWSSYAAPAKIKSMIACAGPHDNKVRGGFIYHKPTTGRWSAELVQPHNFKRPSDKIDTPVAYADICAGMSRKMVELFHGPVLEVISSCIRHFIHDTDTLVDWGEQDNGRSGPVYETRTNNMLDADYAAIEARIVCWLAGQEDALDEYRKGIDRYVLMAMLIFNVPYDQVTKAQRFVGKQAVLGCGFGLGPGGYIKGCAKYKVDVAFDVAEKAVNGYRAKHPKVRAFWYRTEDVCKMSINAPGREFNLGRCKVFTTDLAGKKFLFIKLPSGRRLAYPEPIIKDDRIMFYGQFPKSNQWGHEREIKDKKTGEVKYIQYNDTYGGKLAENITQAVAADIMANGAVKCENAGYHIAALIHDEALAYKAPGQTYERFVELLIDLPAWADGLPVESEGKEVMYYTKS